MAAEVTGPRAVVAEPYRNVKRNSWGAIFAGALIVLTIEMLLGVLGLAIGLTAFNPETERDPAQGLGIGAMIWWIVTGIIALLVGGWTAGRMAGLRRRCDGALHGLVTWALATVLMVWMVFSAVGGILGGAWNVMSSTVQAAGGAVQATGADDAAWQEIQQQVQELMGQGTTGSAGDTAQGNKAIEDALNELLREDPQRLATVSQQDKQAAVDALVANTDLTEAQARQRVDQWTEDYNQARRQLSDTVEELPAKARRYGGKAADAAAKAAWWVFAMMVLGAAAATLGGAIGAPKHLYRDEPYTTTAA